MVNKNHVIFSQQIKSLKVTKIYNALERLFCFYNVLYRAYCNYKFLEVSPCNGFVIWNLNLSTQYCKYILIFFQVFQVCHVVKSNAVCTLSKELKYVLELQFDAKMWLKWFNLLGIASTVCKKEWIWQLLQKIEEKWE